MIELGTSPSGTPHQQAATAGESEAQPPLYLTVEAWVNGYFTPMFLHRVPGSPRVRWCCRWWDHAEAIARLTVLWNGWEAARWEPAAKPSWWLDLDHHLPILIGLDGSFRNCRQPEGQRPGKHEPGTVPRVELTPQGWWD
ncbi:DUF4913 domain-containing protein [Phytohabitans aurantiacus]|uniref:DUF4913 domain-containing protein n=1 Tax=Phytohabitans aurantiacus TaxID=3016789 RepID=A0ABQ5R415_9ACTN|nr:DUF4913 domain-containing protein [Phytohabitans aurantiacus]GLI00922.1 hypothetical protein Pa4123_61980 [Phytohabitans aurantiacus]